MTVGELLPEVLEAVPVPSRATYGKGLRLLGEHFGESPVDEVRLVDLRLLRDRTRREVGEAKVARARETGRRLLAYDPDAHGKGAAENLVRAVRFFFAYACDAGYLKQSPAASLAAPRRGAPPERPLTEEELMQIWRVGVGTGRDAELDELLLTFLRHTAARREGCLNLALGHLDVPTRAVTLTEKR